MKKVISVLLVLVLAFGACVPAFAHSAQQAGECSDLPVVIVRGMDFNGLSIDGLSGKSAVQIDDMNPFRALRGKRFRLSRRIIVKNGRLRHIALFQADAFALFQINRGQQIHSDIL